MSRLKKMGIVVPPMHPTSSNNRPQITSLLITILVLLFLKSLANIDEYFWYTFGDIELNLVMKPCLIQSTNTSDRNINTIKGNRTPKWSVEY